MGVSKHLKARLARLEASVASLPDLQAERERERVALLHSETWLDGGSYEDIPEKDRNASLWETYCRYGHVFLKMIEEERVVDGSEELSAAGIGFTWEERINEDTVSDHTSRTYLREGSGDVRRGDIEASPEAVDS